MIGDRYWATGITLTHFHNGWGASIEYFDAGSANDPSPDGRIATEGTLRTRYSQDTAELAATLVKTDAERFGIEFRPTIGPTPLLYLHRSNWLEPDREIGGEETEAGMKAAAESLGWAGRDVRAGAADCASPDIDQTV